MQALGRYCCYHGHGQGLLLHPLHRHHSRRRHPQRYVLLYLIKIQNLNKLARCPGYDEGGFSASINLPSFVDDYDLSPNSTTWQHNAAGLATRTANITSFGVLGAAIGSLLSLLVNDRFGRLKCWRVYFLVWASGLLIQMFSSGILGLLLFSRIWSGLGAGALTVVTPIFLTEIAQARSRGLVVSIFMVFLLTFLAVGTKQTQHCYTLLEH